jgi:hypothetical protein
VFDCWSDALPPRRLISSMVFGCMRLRTLATLNRLTGITPSALNTKKYVCSSLLTHRAAAPPRGTCGSYRVFRLMTLRRSALIKQLIKSPSWVSTRDEHRDRLRRAASGP